MRLRILAVCAACCGIVYSLFYTDVVLWVEFFWECAFIIVNIFNVIKLISERRNLFLTEEEADIHRVLFRLMPLFDFKKLIASGTWIEFDSGDIIIQEGEHVTEVSVISRGHADILSGKKVVAHCSNGALLGEMSYVTGEPASATVQAAEKSRCIQWDHEELRNLSEKNENIRHGFQAALSENLIRKLQRHKAVQEKPVKKRRKR